MSVLSRAAVDQLHTWGLTRAEWVTLYGFGGQWGGDKCGCPDDRCIGFHHDERDGECGCVDALAGQLFEERRLRAQSAIRVNDGVSGPRGGHGTGRE